MAVSSYPGIPIPKQQSFVEPRIIKIPKVIEAFNNIPASGDFTPFQSDVLLIKSKAYNPFKALDIISFKREPNRKRHFQGIVRTSCGKYVILSGGDHTHNSSQLFICSSPSFNRNERAELGFQVQETISARGKLEEIYTVDRTFWHNGGISVFDHILVVPLESKGFHYRPKYKTKKSIVKFFDITDPLHPKHLSIDIKRDGTNCGTASLVKLKNEFYLCAVWTDSDPGQGARIDFYLSKSKLLSDGFNKHPVSFNYELEFPKSKKKFKRTYQTIHLILQDDGKLFMIGNMNKYGWSPIPKGAGVNYANLYEIDYTLLSSPSNKISFQLNNVMELVDLKKFKGGKDRYNFNGGSGIYITPQKKLALYATHHRTYKNGSAIACTEFYPLFHKASISNKKDAVIELYAKDNYQDRCMRIYGYHANKAYADYKKIMVEGQGFNDKICSIKYQIPIGFSYLLFEHKNYKGKCIKLHGTGKLETIDQIEHTRRRVIDQKYEIPSKMGGEISSSKWQ